MRADITIYLLGTLREEDDEEEKNITVEFHGHFVRTGLDVMP